MRSSSQEARNASDEPLIHEGDLQEVLCQCAGLDIVVVSLADAAEETHGTWPSEFKLEHGEHEALSLQDLLDRIASVDHVCDFLDGWTVDLLVLGSDIDSCGSDELELSQGDNLDGEKSVDAVDGQEERFREQREARVDLGNPIDENRSH